MTDHVRELILQRGKKEGDIFRLRSSLLARAGMRQQLNIPLIARQNQLLCVIG